jgi:hypothetical protein
MDTDQKSLPHPGLSVSIRGKNFAKNARFSGIALHGGILRPNM